MIDRNLGILDSMKHGSFLSSWPVTGYLCSRKQDLPLRCAMTHSFTTPNFCSDISLHQGIPLPCLLSYMGPSLRPSSKAASSKNALFTTSAGNNLPFESLQFFLCNSGNSYHMVPFSLYTWVHIWSVHRTP